MSDIEKRYQGGLDVPPTTDYRTVKQQMRERYTLESRVATGRALALRASDAIDELQEHIDNKPHGLKVHIMNSFGLGASELIERYMTGQ